MGFAEKRGDYWRGRYKSARASTPRSATPTGATMRFRTRRDAEQAANDAEAKVRAGRAARPGRWPGDVRRVRQPLVRRGRIWRASTMQNYRRRLEEHLLPAFEDLAVADDLACRRGGVGEARAGGRATPSRASGRGGPLLHLILADAVEEGLHRRRTRRPGGAVGVSGPAVAASGRRRRRSPRRSACC